MSAAKADFAPPGTFTARQYGCTCDRQDDQRGHHQGPMGYVFVIDPKCPLHGNPKPANIRTS